MSTYTVYMICEYKTENMGAGCKRPSGPLGKICITAGQQARLPRQPNNRSDSRHDANSPDEPQYDVTGCNGRQCIRHADLHIFAVFDLITLPA